MRYKSHGGDNLHSFLKFLSALSLVFCLLIYSIIFLGEKTIPDKITVIENEGYNIPQFMGISLYSIESEEKAGVVLGNVKESLTPTEIKLLSIIPVKNTIITNSKRQYVTVGGDLFGIKLYTDGVIIVDIDEIETDFGVECPGKKADIKIGDIVKSVNGTKVVSSSHFSKMLQESKGKEIQLTVLRKNKTINLIFKTVKEKDSDTYKAGLWVRDSTAGLGTVTFYNKSNNTFAGLGHPICDVDTNEIMPVKTGIMADVLLTGLTKSSFGNVGELCGKMTGKECGVLSLNDETGIYGYSVTDKTDEIPVAVKQETKEGKAQIVCTVTNAEPEYYDIEITKIYINSSSVNKDMIIRITDEKLLNITGGIVQGMSGSPIIQNGKLVGAVTHVFVNNPKQGYAIFAERMLETSNSQEKISTEQLKDVS